MCTVPKARILIILIFVLATASRLSNFWENKVVKRKSAKKRTQCRKNERKKERKKESKNERKKERVKARIFVTHTNCGCCHLCDKISAQLIRLRS